MHPRKPLGHKSYGSIPHLPGSRLGEGDHHCHEGQAAICLTKTRDRHDAVIVTEKLDGSNVAIANIDGQIVALTRAGYVATTSPYEQHHMFAHWVREQEARFKSALEPGQRLVGEWLAQAHGTRYALEYEPFVGFDLMEGKRRLPYAALSLLADQIDLTTPVILSLRPLGIEEVMDLLDDGGHHGALDPVEGAVWRVERKGEFDFAAKFVRHDKVDGKYLPEVSGEPAVWNWRAWEEKR